MPTSSRLISPTPPEACRGWPVRRDLPQLKQYRRSELFHEFDHAIALIAPHAAEEAIREMFRALPGLVRRRTSNKSVGSWLQLNGFFDELGQAIFHANARTKIAHQVPGARR